MPRIERREPAPAATSSAQTNHLNISLPVLLDTAPILEATSHAEPVSSLLTSPELEVPRAAAAPLVDRRAKVSSFSPVPEELSALEHNRALLAEGDAARTRYQGALVSLAQGGKLPAELLESGPWIDLYERTGKALLETAVALEQMSEKRGPTYAALELQEQTLLGQKQTIDAVIQAQKQQLQAGKTGYVFALRDRAVELSRAGLQALSQENDAALEKRELQLALHYQSVKAELALLRTEKARAEATVKTFGASESLSSAELYTLKDARLALAGAVLDTHDQPITLARQIRALEGAAIALLETQKTIDARRRDLAELVKQVAKGRGLDAAANGDNQNTIDTISRIERHAPTSGLTEKDGILSLEISGKNNKSQTLRLGPKSSFAETRAFVATWSALQQRQLAGSYYQARELLLKNGIREDELARRDLKKLPNAPEPGFVEARLPRLMELFNQYFDRASEEPATSQGAQLLVRAARADIHRRSPNEQLGREYLLLLVTDREATEQLLAATGMDAGAAITAAPKMIAFVRALLSNKTIQNQLSAGADGGIDLREVEKYAEQWKLISDYSAKLRAGTFAPPPSSKKSPDATYFRGAMAKVHALDPVQAPWGFTSSRFFAHLADLDEGQRAFTLGLFDAHNSEKRGPNYLNELFKNMKPGDAVAYARILTGSTAKEEALSFVQYWLSEPNGVDRFAEHHRIGLGFLKQADAKKGVDLPVALMQDYESRVGQFEVLAQERRGLLAKNTPKAEVQSLDQRIARLAGELRVLSAALTNASNAEQEDHARAVNATRAFIKQLGVAAAATAAAYFTAGVLAPGASTAWGALLAATVATSAGTVAGMGAALVFDVAEQAGGKGIGNISVKDAGVAALDAAPAAFTAALATGVMTAAMILRTGAIYKGIEVAKNAGTLTRGMELGAKVRVAGEMGIYTSASTYVGNIASAGYLRARGKTKEAELLMEHAGSGAVFAGASSVLLMPLSRVQGASKLFTDAGTNVAQAVAFNKIIGNAWDAGLADAAVFGGVMGRIYARRQNNLPVGQRSRDVVAARNPDAHPDPRLSNDAHYRLGIQAESHWVVSRNENDGLIYRSTTATPQASPHYEGFVVSAGDRPVTIISGFHGSPHGETQPHRDFYERDLLYFSKYKNVTVIDGAHLTGAEKQAILNRPGVIIVSSCHSVHTW
jgi:hypothetical protein